MSLLATVTLFPSEFLQSQTRPLPVVVTCRKSFLQGSYVLQIQNSSDEELNLWLQAKGKVSPIVLSAGKTVEIGWVQGYRFDANNHFLIGADGYDTLKQVMPNIELSPWRIGFAEDGGLAVSLSQSFLQDRLPKHMKLPIKEKASNALEISLDQVPQIVLKEGSDRIYADATLQATLFSGKLRVPIAANVSFIPFYTAGTGEIGVSQIQIENIEMVLMPREWLDVAIQIVNRMLPALFEKVVIYRLSKTQKGFARLLNVRSARVSDGRLEISIF